MGGIFSLKGESLMDKFNKSRNAFVLVSKIRGFKLYGFCCILFSVGDTTENNLYNHILYFRLKHLILPLQALRIFFVPLFDF